MSHLLFENLEHGDLKRIVHPELHVDEYKSKMGNDADICVVSLKVSGKEPSADLVAFIEKGYDWVLDADVSSGEKEDGDYLVFIELDRTKDVPLRIMEMMNGIFNLTEQSFDEWRLRYHKSTNDHDLSEESLKKLIPLTSEEYERKYKSESDKSEKDAEDTSDIDKLKSAAGIKIDKTAPKNDHTENLRIAAGIK